MANSVDPDQMPQNAASDLDLRCLLRHVCLNTMYKYGKVYRNKPSCGHEPFILVRYLMLFDWCLGEKDCFYFCLILLGKIWTIACLIAAAAYVGVGVFMCIPASLVMPAL